MIRIYSFTRVRLGARVMSVAAFTSKAQRASRAPRLRRKIYFFKPPGEDQQRAFPDLAERKTMIPRLLKNVLGHLRSIGEAIFFLGESFP